MDNGFITNPVRIVMGYAGTGLLYYFGMKYYGKKNKVFGLTLLGGFIALGILTTFAAHHLYGYFSFIVAFIIGVAYIAAGLWLSEITKSETLSIFSAIAGFLLPFLLEGESATSIQFCAYILILFLSLFYVTLRQKHKYTFYISFLLFHLTLLTYGVLSGDFGDELIIVGTVLVQHILLLAFYLMGKIERHVFTEALIYSNFVFALGWIKVLEYDQEILVNGWGLSEEVLTPVDYMENLGIHLLFGDVVKITYGNHRLQVVVDEKDFGYKLITVSKGYLEEGDLQIVFLNTQGVPISYEEDYVYSIPLEYTLVETGDSQSKASTVFMEVLDTETLPVLTGMNPALLKQHSGSVLLYIEGGEIATMQRNGNTLRVYTEAKPVYQVVAVDTSLFNPGQNIIRLIDSADLSVKSQIIFMIPDK